MEYYPFGMSYAENMGHGIQPFKYNGKELTMMNGLNLYDYHARQYDPAVGRFLTVDPLAEKKPWTSSYVYCSNNPTNRVDPDGREDRSGKPSTINKVNGVPTSAQSSVRTNEPKVEVKPIPYTQPIITGEIRDANKVKMQEQHNFAMSTEINKACLTNPVLKAEAVGGLAVAGTALAGNMTLPSVNTMKAAVSNTANWADFTAIGIQNTSGVSAIGTGIGAGLIQNILPYDAPNISINPTIDVSSSAIQILIKALEITNEKK